jgi:sodium transport system ATP-binding protein
MIEVEQLRKRFGEIVAVDGASFSAGNGSVTGLLGPNGAGKTTTLRMLYGLIEPDAGQMRIDGIDVGREPLSAQSRIGVLPDAHGLYQRLTAREHVRYFGQLHGLAGPDLEGRIEELIQLLEMNEIADRRAQGFSHGERMKVFLARALVHGPNNLMLDEPTNGLDVQSTRAVRRLIRNLRDEGHCVLFSSHVMQEVSTLCDHIVIMAAGAIAAQGTPEELLRQTGHRNLEDAFVVLTGIDELPA